MNLGDDERQENIKTYFFRAKKRFVGLNSGLDNQFYAEGLKDIWHSFDAFLGLKFPEQNNKKMRIDFVKKYQLIFNKWKMSDLFEDLVKRLKIFGKLRDMSPINQKSPIEITDEKNLLEILDFSYRVRSSLNHGGKDVESNTKKAKTNRSLVEFSFKITYEILEKVLLEEKMI
jgi:hypothetical protein